MRNSVAALFISSMIILSVVGVMILPTTPGSAEYSQNLDTIFVKGENNTLESLAADIDDPSVFSYYSENSTALCRANLTIEGNLTISNEVLMMEGDKKITVNSTAYLEASSSIIKAIPQELRWWETPYGYSLVKEDGGTLILADSSIHDTGFDTSGGERGIEVFGPPLTVVNTSFSEGTKGVLFVGDWDGAEVEWDNVSISSMSENGVEVLGGVDTLVLKNSSFHSNRGYDILNKGGKNVTLLNTSFENYDVQDEGYVFEGYFIDFAFYDGDDPIPNTDVMIYDEDGFLVDVLQTDDHGKIDTVPFTWAWQNQTSQFRRRYRAEVEGESVWFSPSAHNRLTVDISEPNDISFYNVSVSPSSFVPVNNDLEPHNVTLRGKVQNHGDQYFSGSVSFYFKDVLLAETPVELSENETVEVMVVCVPEVAGHSKIRGTVDVNPGKTPDNNAAWSRVFFAGYYNETVVPLGEPPLEASLAMMEHGVANEDGDGHYTIYENWLPEILIEVGLNHLAAYHVTENGSYLDRAEKQIDYALGFRDDFGLFNRSTAYTVRNNYPDTYHEWSTHRNVRSALALQQAYLYTGNASYREHYDQVVDFLLNKVAMENITWHDTEYYVPWESAIPNEGEGGIKGTSKNFPFVFVNGYMQMGRLLVQSYFDENLNSSYFGDQRLLPHIHTCIEYILNDQYKEGDSVGTWPYFSYYREPINRTRLWMHYAALTAMELANTNTYLHWDNISAAINRYVDYISGRFTIRSAIDTNEGGNGRTETYVFVRSLYNTTGRNVSQVDEFLFSNVFFNDDKSINSFRLDEPKRRLDPTKYGFIYVHYNPLRTHMWDIYNAERSSNVFQVDLTADEADGWNFVSFPVVPPDKTIERVLESVNGSYERVISYDSDENKWRSHSPSRDEKFNNLEKIDHRMGFWIKVLNNCTLEVKGYLPSTTNITLQPGWNMVGPPSLSADNHGLPAEVTKIGYFESSLEYNLAYDYDPENYTFEPGHGYWLYNSAAHGVVWTIDN